MNILWSPQARADLVDVWSHIASDSPTAADAVENRLIDAIEGLADFPLQDRAGRSSDVRELVAARTPYIVIYRVRAGHLEIVRLWHGAREPFA